MNVMDSLDMDILDDRLSDVTRQLTNLSKIMYKYQYLSKSNHAISTKERHIRKRRLFSILLEKFEEYYKASTAQFILDNKTIILQFLNSQCDIHWSEQTLHQKLYSLTLTHPQLGSIEQPHVVLPLPPEKFVLEVFEHHYKDVVGHIPSEQLEKELEYYFLEAGFTPLGQNQYKRIFLAHGYIWTRKMHLGRFLHGVIREHNTTSNDKKQENIVETKQECGEIELPQNTILQETSKTPTFKHNQNPYMVLYSNKKEVKDPLWFYISNKELELYYNEKKIVDLLYYSIVDFYLVDSKSGLQKIDIYSTFEDLKIIQEEEFCISEFINLMENLIKSSPNWNITMRARFWLWILLLEFYLLVKIQENCDEKFRERIKRLNFVFEHTRKYKKYLYGET